MAKILVADDTDALRRLLTTFLASEGHQVLTAANGAEALALAERERPDLILLDVVMPLVDGFEALRLLRSHGPTKETPVIMLTVKDSEEDIARGWKLGADFYLTKPFEVRQLLSVVRNLLTKEPAPQSPAAPAPDS